MNTTTNAILTVMCIVPDLDWQGQCTDHPTGVYCAVTLQLLGQSEPGAKSQPDGTIRLRFAGVDMIATPAGASSRWWNLAALEAAS